MQSKGSLYGNLFQSRICIWGIITPGSVIYILSGKHYLLNPDTEVDPYNVYLGDFSAEERKEWAVELIKKMKAAHIDFNAKTYFLAGKDYTEYLVDSFPNAVCPFDKPSINGMGDIIHWCQSHTKPVKEGFKSLKDFLLEQTNMEP